MAITRANVESILIRRLGALLTEAGLDGTTVDGSNVDLNDPIGWAVRQADGSVDDPATVDDEDVQTVATADLDKLLDLAEYRALESISGNLNLVDIESGPFRQSFNQLRVGLEQRIARKRKQLERDYDFGDSGFAASVIELDRIDGYAGEADDTEY
jgi:hypothetical protein